MKYVQQAIQEIDSRLRQLTAARAALTHLNNFADAVAQPKAKLPKGARKPLSQAAIARIRKAQKARWAKFHAAQAKGKAKGGK